MEVAGSCIPACRRGIARNLRQMWQNFEWQVLPCRNGCSRHSTIQSGPTELLAQLPKLRPGPVGPRATGCCLLPGNVGQALWPCCKTRLQLWGHCGRHCGAIIGFMLHDDGPSEQAAAVVCVWCLYLGRTYAACV